MTCSRRHVVCVVAAVAFQHEVSVRIIYGRIVGHIRGTGHPYASKVHGGGIADHCASLADIQPQDASGAKLTFSTLGSGPKSAETLAG